MCNNKSLIFTSIILDYKTLLNIFDIKLALKFENKFETVESEIKLPQNLEKNLVNWHYNETICNFTCLSYKQVLS